MIKFLTNKYQLLDTIDQHKAVDKYKYIHLKATFNYKAHV